MAATESDSECILPDIGDANLTSHNTLSSSPPSRSGPLRTSDLMQLAAQRLVRFTSLGLSLGQKEDLDASITHITEAILSHSLFPDAPCFRLLRHLALDLAVTMLFTLAQNLVFRHAVFQQPKDNISSVKYLRYLRDNFYPFEAFQVHVARDEFIATFVEALSRHVILKTGDDESEHFKEMANLLRELGTSDFSTGRPFHAVHFLCGAIIKIYLWHDSKVPPDQVIEVLREVMMHNPDLEQVFLALTVCLNNRFYMTHVMDDYEEAISIVDKFFASHPIGDTVTQTQEKALYLVLWLREARFSVSATPEFLEDVISHLRALLRIHSLPEPSRTAITRSLDRFVQQRSEHFGVPGNSTETLPDHSGVVPGSSSSPILTTDQPTVELANDALAQIREKQKLLTGLFTAISNNDNADVEEIVKLGRTMLPLAHSSYRYSYLFHHKFAEILFQAYLRTNILDYLDEVISIYRDMDKNCRETLGRTLGRLGLTTFLLQRLNALHHREDEEEIMQLYPLIMDGVHWQSYQRLEFSCLWATIARVGAHPSTSVAYENAMSLLQDTLVFSPTLQTQHFRLVRTLRKAGWMPLDYASYQIDKDQLKQAIETLERGRSLLWSEMRGLRTSTDQLRKVDPAIADKFTETNRALEIVATTVAETMNTASENHVAGGGQGMDPFGNLLMQQRKLLEVRGSLIPVIQTLPGFENFLKPPPFDFLNSAAARGPVILINQSRWRSDIVILLKDSPPSLISTPPNFHVRANRLKEQLLSVRKDKGLGSNDYDLTLASVLADLYELVGKPVLERLRKLEVPDKSRVWWCPTSAFCSLPLHAMGPIPSDDDHKLYFMDLYIPSYTPSLTALIESRKHDSQPQTFHKPSLLLIAQPETLPGAEGEIKVIESIKTSVTTLVSELATPMTVADHLRDHRFAHFVCHGLLEPGQPFDASFELHGDNLTLLEIVRSQLPAAEFAFLSACHTAELTEDSIADEGLHLAAAMQYCGFRSVVGTMWAMADTDGADLSKHFYKSIFSDKASQNGVPFSERSAKALQLAVKKLRKKRGMTLERWVNFVHYGA
ncbi:CHAT domain containing protein [Lactarius tabidus]